MRQRVSFELASTAPRPAAATAAGAGASGAGTGTGNGGGGAVAKEERWVRLPDMDVILLAVADVLATGWNDVWPVRFAD
jgi:hypothetical protein